VPMFVCDEWDIVLFLLFVAALPPDVLRMLRRELAFLFRVALTLVLRPKPETLRRLRLRIRMHIASGERPVFLLRTSATVRWGLLLGLRYPRGLHIGWAALAFVLASLVPLRHALAEALQGAIIHPAAVIFWIYAWAYVQDEIHLWLTHGSVLMVQRTPYLLRFAVSPLHHILLLRAIDPGLARQARGRKGCQHSTCGKFTRVFYMPADELHPRESADSGSTTGPHGESRPGRTRRVRERVPVDRRVESAPELCLVEVLPSLVREVVRKGQWLGDPAELGALARGFSNGADGDCCRQTQRPLIPTTEETAKCCVEAEAWSLGVLTILALSSGWLVLAVTLALYLVGTVHRIRSGLLVSVAGFGHLPAKRVVELLTMTAEKVDFPRRGLFRYVLEAIPSFGLGVLYGFILLAPFGWLGPRTGLRVWWWDALFLPAIVWLLGGAH